MLSALMLTSMDGFQNQHAQGKTAGGRKIYTNYSVYIRSEFINVLESIHMW